MHLDEIPIGEIWQQLEGAYMKPSSLDEFWDEYRIELDDRGYRVPPMVDLLWYQLMLRRLTLHIARRRYR